MDTVDIIMVQYKYVLVSRDRSDWEFPCLVRVRLGLDVLSVNYAAQNIVGDRVVCFLGGLYLHLEFPKGIAELIMECLQNEN